MTQSDTQAITQELAEFAAGTVEIPDDTGVILRMSLLDWLAVGRAGAGEPVAGILREMAHSEAGAAQSAIFGSTTRVPARMAALVNGTTSHALDYDDTHFTHIGHPSVAVISAALAVGEQAGATGRAVQEAALIGMEVSIRLGQWLGRDHYQIGFHQTATAGAFGAAVAAGRLLDLGAAQMCHVLGLAATRAAGLKAQFGTMGKPYNAGQAAANGVEVAQLVGAGFKSDPTALDGPFGFGATHHAVADTGALHGLGEHWKFDNISHKFHACCHGLHASIEALESLKPITAQQVEEIRITTHPRWLSVCNQPAPMTGLGAKFSYSTVIALSLLGHDTARLDTFTDALCADPKMQALRNRVAVVANADFSETEAEITVMCRNGAQVNARHDLQKAMSLRLRQDRVHSKAVALIGTDRAGQVWDVLHQNGSAADIAAMMRV